MSEALSRFETTVLTGADDARGCLIYLGGRLCAVLVQLGDAHGELEGRWHLEAGFGPCEGRGEVFATLDAAERWIMDRLSRI